MANVVAGLGIQIFDNTYTGGASDKIASVSSGRLLVETGNLNIQGLTSGTPVITTEEEISNNIITAYGTSANVTSTTSSIVSYYSISGGTTFYLKEVIASASSGPVKVIVEYAAAATGPSSGTYAVGFFSSANPTLTIPFYQPIAISGPLYIRVTMKNDSAFTQDLYSTIIGRFI
jgi:hypothetical protein